MQQFYRIKLNNNKIAKSFGISGDEVTDIFSDGRNISKLTEYWSSKLYGFRVSGSSNAPVDGDNGKNTFSIRCINKTVNFNSSINRGGKRSSCKKTISESIDKVDYFIVVDIINFPYVNFIPIKSDKIDKDLIPESGTVDRKNFFGKILNKQYCDIDWTDGTNIIFGEV